MTEPVLEYDVNYTDIKSDADERGWKQYKYTSKHSATGKITECSVFCESEQIFTLLLKKWNRLTEKDWCYEKI